MCTVFWCNENRDWTRYVNIDYILRKMRTPPQNWRYSLEKASYQIIQINTFLDSLAKQQSRFIQSPGKRINGIQRFNLGLKTSLLFDRATQTPHTHCISLRRPWSGRGMSIITMSPSSFADIITPRPPMSSTVSPSSSCSCTFLPKSLAKRLSSFR